MTRRALLIGGSGYIGTRLSAALLARDWSVTSFALMPSTVAGVENVIGDRHVARDRESIRGEFDAVVDLVAYRPADTLPMVALWRSRTARFVHLSTVAVYAALHAPRATEDLAERWAEANGGYGQEKAACERVLEAAHRTDRFPFVVVRSPGLIGPDDPVSREAYYAKRILAGRPIVQPAPLDGFATILLIDDLVATLIEAMTSLDPVGRAYHLAMPDAPSLREHIETIARIVGRRADVRETELATLTDYGFRPYAFPYGVPPRQRLDVRRAMRDLDFRPTPYAAAIERTMSGILQRADPSAWPGRASTQARLCGTHEWLHADLERHFLGHARPVWTRTADEPLLPLRGWSTARQPTLFVAAETWRSIQRPLDAPASGNAVVMPAALIRRLTGREPASTFDPELRLAAVLEPPVGDGPHALFTQRHPGTHDYGHGEGVTDLRVVPFRDLDPERVGANERVLADVAEAEDQAALRTWLDACDAGGGIDVRAAESYARVIVPRLCRWLPFRIDRDALAGASVGSERVCDCPPNMPRVTSAYAAAFDAIRLLLASDVVLPGDGFRLRIATIGDSDRGAFALRPPLLLVGVDERAFVADIVEERLFSLAPRLAEVVQIALRAPTVAGAMTEAGSLNVPPQAMTAVLQSLLAAKVLVRRE